MEIAIFGRDGGLAQRIIAPEERRQARMLWAFLISNLQTGFQVALEDGTGSITRDSGALVPVHLLERLMSGARLDELT